MWFGLVCFVVLILVLCLFCCALFISGVEHSIVLCFACSSGWFLGVVEFAGW